MKTKTIFGLITLFLFLLSSISVHAQITDTGTSGETVVHEPEQIRPLSEGPTQEQIDIAVNYVKQKLGEEYYNQFITIKTKTSYEKCNKDQCRIETELFFSNSKLDGLATETRFSGPIIKVTLDKDNKVIEYAGPTKAYDLKISPEMAVEKATEYGIKTANFANIATSTRNSGEYELIWAVTSEDETGDSTENQPFYRGVYVDVETGEIRGEFKVNPLILESSGGAKEAKLGEFFTTTSPPQTNNLPENEPTVQTNGQSKYLWIIAGLTGVVIIGLAFFLIKKK